MGVYWLLSWLISLCFTLINSVTKTGVLGVLVFRCWRRRSSPRHPRRRPRPPCSCRGTRSSTASKLVVCRGARTSCKSWDARKTIILRLAFLPLRLPSSTTRGGSTVFYEGAPTPYYFLNFLEKKTWDLKMAYGVCIFSWIRQCL